MSLLTAVQQACTELALSVPATVITNQDTQVAQLLSLATREGREFSRIPGQWSGWPEMRREFTFSLVPATTGSNNGVYVGNTTTGSTVITGISSTTGILAGYGVSGGSILTGAMVTAVGPNSVTLNTPANSNATALNFSFGQVAYNLPADYKYMMVQTEWDRNFRWQMLGPLSGQEWQTIVSGISPVGPRIRFRIMANPASPSAGLQYWIQPPPGAAQTDVIAFEYMSTSWCQSFAGVYQSAWAADTDLYLWDDDLLTLGLKWRFLRSKGLDYGEEREQYQKAVEMQTARSGSSRSLPLGSRNRGMHLLNNSNVPDTGYGS